MQMGWIVLVTQIIFLWLRTLNIKYIDKGKVWPAIWTGNGIGLMWMIGISVGANAMMEGHWFPIVMHLIGGSVGTYIGMHKKVR